MKVILAFCSGVKRRSCTKGFLTGLVSCGGPPPGPERFLVSLMVWGAAGDGGGGLLPNRRIAEAMKKPSKSN